MVVWFLIALLSSLICRAKQDGSHLSIKDVKVFAEETHLSDNGAWVLNVAWKHGNNDANNASYDIEVLYSEQMSIVHFENIRLNPDKTGLYLWKWTSPVPLQCTSHSIRLRHLDQNHISEWTSLYVLKGEDQTPGKTVIYPQDHVFMVGSSVRFCCILETSKTMLSNYSEFVIRISNRTYTTRPIFFQGPSTPTSDIHCDVKEGNPAGSSVFVGYPPDDQNLTCVTRDLSSVECNWKLGRETHLHGTKKTNYNLNGRECDFNQCGQLMLSKQVTNWTLIAINPLGQKILMDTANPMHRILLRAPRNVSYVAHERSVALRWSWSFTKSTFPVICQVMLSGSIYNETFSGDGLESVVLEHLQPFTYYTAKVRCGSSEHFYKWGDWSKITKFSTKEDFPEAVDVWVHYSERNPYVLWKPLTKQQSHGKLTGYKLTLENNTAGEKQEIDIGPSEELCYETVFGNEKISISGKNSAGLSPLSTVSITRRPENRIQLRLINGSEGGFEMNWKKHPHSTCGYVVEWFPTNSKTGCVVEWKKIPGCVIDACETWKLFGSFEAGVRYSISVYACTDDEPVLLQRNEGYTVEQRPVGTVQNLRGKKIGKSFKLSWDEVPLAQQQGFIVGYRVTTIDSASKAMINSVTLEKREVNLSLGPGSYTFRVSAFTSRGEGNFTISTMDIENELDQVIAAAAVGCSAVILVFIISLALCYSKKEWLKNLLYPDIPEPKLAGEWTKGINCTHATGGHIYDIQDVCFREQSSRSEDLQDTDLHRSDLSAHFYQDIISPTTENNPSRHSARFENLTYDLVMTEPGNIPQGTELLKMEESYLPVETFLQTQNTVEEDCFSELDCLQHGPYIVEESYLPTQIFVQNYKALKESGAYKPQF